MLVLFPSWVCSKLCVIVPNRTKWASGDSRGLRLSAMRWQNRNGSFPRVPRPWYFSRLGIKGRHKFGVQGARVWFCQIHWRIPPSKRLDVLCRAHFASGSETGEDPLPQVPHTRWHVLSFWARSWVVFPGQPKETTMLFAALKKTESPR